MVAAFSLLMYRQPRTHLLMHLNIFKHKFVLYIHSHTLGMQSKSQETVQLKISGACEKEKTSSFVGIREIRGKIMGFVFY